ncbi:MAG: hypothetical protein KBS94_06815 [Prevotella sp.]|nr:hypothetical protein [Candidatus Equicola faecalis]
MYDTVFLYLPITEAGGVDFMSETACYIDNVNEHTYNGVTRLSGEIGGLHVFITENALKINGGSLCKYYLGDNYQSMTRKTTQGAIEKISDTLHLSMGRADVQRIDIAMNVVLKHPTNVYFDCLEDLTHAERWTRTNSLYYDCDFGLLCFYDKNKQTKAEHEEIPELYRGKNVLRYEQRYTKRLPKHLKRERVQACLLYDEAFYISLLQRWEEMYKSIEKSKTTHINGEYMIGVKELNTVGILALAKMLGGKDKLLKEIERNRLKGVITPKAKHDLVNRINEVFKAPPPLLTDNEDVKELDKKIKGGLKYFR